MYKSMTGIVKAVSKVDGIRVRPYRVLLEFSTGIKNAVGRVETIQDTVYTQEPPRVGDYARATLKIGE
jgi:hypothetical protein